MNTMRRFWVGADPGGKGAFGLAFVDVSGAMRCKTVSSVDEAVKAVTTMGKPLGLGIDAPMWWSAGEGGGRRADARLRERYGIPGGTVQSGNSLRGAALIGGALLASRIRDEFPGLRITESHPKALLLPLGHDATRFAARFGIEARWANEHERDAAIAAVWRLSRARDKRDTAAMTLLQNGVDCGVIALWLGHESVETTYVYLHADLKLKERAMAKTTPSGMPPARYQPDDELLAFLNSL